MNIGFVFTNFNNSSYTREAIRSLEQSSCADKCFVVVVDNASNSGDVESLRAIELEYPRTKIIYNQENLGYFRGLNVGIKHLKETEIALDCIVVGNNDLVFPPDFLGKVASSQECLCRYAVISPDLITLDGVHQNPHVREGISAFREYVWDIYYSNYYLALFIKWGAKITRIFSERKDYTNHQVSGVIYQGYGACYILTPVFFKYFDDLWAPTFLMGEEYFLWKQLAEKNLEIFYEPNICVHHHDHATTDNMPSKKLWKISRESHYVYKKYRS